MTTNHLIWFAVLSVFVALIFAYRGKKLARWKFTSNFLTFFLFLFLALVLIPSDMPAEVIQYSAVSIIIFAATAILFDFLSGGFIFIKNMFLYGNLFTGSLPAYLVEVCRAAEFLSNRKVGALIVIEKRNDLNSILAGGMNFDSDIKAEVLSALFEKNSNVHDGAVIIRRGRIARLKAILPVSTNEGIPAQLGTRHRSAIGVTEKTDAIALVISEERGEISLAYRGKLSNPPSQKELSRLLGRALRGKK